MTNPIEMVFIPLNNLVQSPYNVRKTRSEESLADLQASPLAQGVLENLIVYEADHVKAVAAGERRRAALKASAKAKKIPSITSVPCLVRPEEDAVELSRAENILRVAMLPTR